jgi:hypothetical protein
MSSLPEACAHACPIRNHNSVTSVALSLEFSRVSTRVASETLLRRRVWSNGFIPSRNHPLRSPASRKLSLKCRFGESNRRA